MPTYGDDKVKDMIESLLPSVARRKARSDRKAIHRNTRRMFRQQFDIDNDKLGPSEYPNYKIHQMKWERRDADNVSAFVRWAIGATRHLDDPEDRYNFIKKLVPDNTIGRHALTHIDFLPEFEFKEEVKFGPGGWSIKYLERQGQAAEAEAARKKALVTQLHQVIEAGQQSALNRAIKRLHRIESWSGEHRRWTRQGWIVEKCSHRPRLLMGLHDIDDFIEEIHHKMHPEWARALTQFLTHI